MSKPEYINDPILNGSICPYCGEKTEYVDSSIIYGKSYGMIYLCRSCDAYCGVHKGTNISLGRLANKELRGLKKEAHKLFDQLWKDGLMSRKEAYAWLKDSMKVDPNKNHIGMFDEKQCKDAIYFSTLLLKIYE